MKKEHALLIIDDIEEEKTLIGWEESFIESIKKQLETKDFLSDKQASILENILRKESEF